MIFKTYIDLIEEYPDLAHNLPAFDSMQLCAIMKFPACSKCQWKSLCMNITRKDFSPEIKAEIELAKTKYPEYFL